jgi:hypothetical protein
VCRSVGRSSDFFFPLPTLSLSLLFSTRYAYRKRTEERKKKKEVIVKGVVVDFSLDVCSNEKEKWKK